MKSFLQLNLQGSESKPETMNLSAKSEGEQAQPVVSAKRLSRIANRIAHKGASTYGRSSSGPLSK